MDAWVSSQPLARPPTHHHDPPLSDRLVLPQQHGFLTPRVHSSACPSSVDSLSLAHCAPTPACMTDSRSPALALPPLKTSLRPTNPRPTHHTHTLRRCFFFVALLSPIPTFHPEPLCLPPSPFPPSPSVPPGGPLSNPQVMTKLRTTKPSKTFTNTASQYAIRFSVSVRRCHWRTR